MISSHLNFEKQSMCYLPILTCVQSLPCEILPPVSNIRKDFFLGSLNN